MVEQPTRRFAGIMPPLVTPLTADGPIVVPPFYYPIDQEAVKRHYRAVREAGLPVLAYHIPGMTKVPIEPETLLALAEEDTLCGVKDSAGNFGYYERVVDGTRGI